MQVCHCKHCIDDVSQVLLENIKLKLKHHEFLYGLGLPTLTISWCGKL
ncbi:hypothetical protein NC651_007946 [Populus alba x Populus x berolinensis]|nr:hypothetical protein NC651_007946 [Populus alba x Populus x berolinensis]